MSIHPIAGIDYGCGSANTDPETGIRYGVINGNSLNGDFLNDFKPQYDYEHDDDCDKEDCRCFDCCDPSSLTYQQDGIVAEYFPNSNVVMVFKSETIVACRFCSPCYPGAGDLDNIVAGGIQTYGLPDDCLANDEDF